MYRVELSRSVPTKPGYYSSAIIGKCEDALVKMYPGQGLDWAPGMSHLERYALYKKHFGFLVIPTDGYEFTVVEFESEQDFLIFLLDDATYPPEEAPLHFQK